MRVIAGLALLVSACGDGAVNPDADSRDVGPRDSSVDAFIDPSCDYTEQADATNDTSAEATTLTFASQAVLCGTIDHSHFAGGAVDIGAYDGHLAGGTVDLDSYTFTVTTTTDVLMHVTGVGAEALDDVILHVRSSSMQSLASAHFEGDHGTLYAHLTPGTYTASVGGFHASSVAAAIQYRVKIVTDAPATRCPPFTGGSLLFEPQSNDNDVLQYSRSLVPHTSLTPSTTDAPSGSFIIFPGGGYAIGASAEDANPSDDYMDRDTYAVVAGAMTTQLTIRVKRYATTIDFDFLVSYANSEEAFAGNLDTATAEDELATFAVQPGATLWLWFGARDGATGLPQSYDATICPETFSP